MGSASAGCPFGVSSRCYGKIGAFSHKVQLFGACFPLHVEFPRTNLYPSSASSFMSSKEIVTQICSLPDSGEFFPEEASTPILDLVENPMHLKNLSLKELKQLSDEIRLELSSIMLKTQKSFKASLAVTELTVAIHHVFHAPVDKILWDAVEQTYAHKILTGRRALVHTVQRNGLSVSASRTESEYDPFGAGHGCNSVSAGLGMAIARDIKGKRERIVTVISNGTTMAGQVYEAMGNAGYFDSNMVVILNDSRHSLHPKIEEGPKTSISALSSTLSKLQSSNPFGGLEKLLRMLQKELVCMNWLLKLMKENRGVENNPKIEGAYKHPEGLSSSADLAPRMHRRTYSDCFVEALVTEAEKDKDIVTVHAGMHMETSFELFRERFPDKFFDVGMAEQHAVTFSAGLSRGGLKPFCIIPSTFLQRAYDQVVHDVDRQRIPVRFAITSAGLVGSDGPMQCGAFDITFMSCLPNMIVMAPSNEDELANMVATAASIDDRPVCFRYPRGAIVGMDHSSCRGMPIEIGKGKILAEGKDVALLGYGSMVQNCLKARSLLSKLGIEVTVADARFCKPLDIKLLRQLCENHSFLITVEEGSIGGFGSHVAQFFSLDGQLDGKIKWRPIVLPDNYIEHASPSEQLAIAGLTGHHIAATALRMDSIRSPFKGIVNDFKGRKACYKQDWIGGMCSGFRILAPTFYIFFASALPVIAFGEQLSRDTEGSLSTVETLASTAICGVIQSLFGGQPLLVLGVAEPTVIMYNYMYTFSKKRPELGGELFLAWTGWVCVWTSLLLILLAIFNACNIISRFTRIAGELFGMLISVLFIQEAIKGVVSEFSMPKEEDPDKEEFQFQWLYTNGLLAVIFCFGLLLTALKSRKARSWLYGTGWLRSFIADYGVPLMVLVWTAMSYGVPRKVPHAVPRRLLCPYPWDKDSLYHWTVIMDMGEVPVTYIFAAIIPAIMIAGLYFFDHSVASQLAQQKEFNLQKPSAYHYDLFLLGIMTLICGLLGLPPSNGVLPQSPMHTKSLATLRKQVIRKKMVKSAKDCMKENGSNSEIYGRMEAVFIEMEGGSPPNPKELANLKEAVMNAADGGDLKGKFDPEKHIDAHLPVRVNEQRVSNLLQSLLVGVSILGIAAIKMIPTSVLWGYFAYMAIDSLPGSQFFERVLLLFISPSRRYKVLEGSHASFVELVPYKYIVGFTLFQVVYFLMCFGVTWIPIAGILFPLPFFLLISIRQHLLPKFFPPSHLQELDSCEWEECPGAPQEKPPEAGGDEGADAFFDAELLDEMTTSRGELKLRTSFSSTEDRFSQVHPDDAHRI
ncbi:hypothetical protein ACLB2K_010166 [Fragaria x ananassa]